MSAGFTPGPWYYQPDSAGAGYDRIREEASDYIIATAEDGGHVDPTFALPQVTIEANARLIAAAPELYAALDALLRRIDDHFDSSFGTDWDWQEQAVARNALAKARAEQVHSDPLPKEVGR